MNGGVSAGTSLRNDAIQYVLSQGCLTTLVSGMPCPEQHDKGLALVESKEVYSFTRCLRDIEKSSEGEGEKLKQKVMMYALKQIFFRSIMGVEGFPIVLDFGPKVPFQETEVTHEMWIQRFVELINIKGRRAQLAKEKIDRLLTEGISATIGTVSSPEPDKKGFLIISLRDKEPYQACLKEEGVTKKLTFNYNTADLQGNTALDKLIQKVNLSAGELELFCLLNDKGAKIASTSLEKLEEFKSSIQKNHSQVYRHANFENKIAHLASTKLNLVPVQNRD